MNKHKKTVAIIKDIIIVLLFLSAVFLGWKSQLFGNSSSQMSDIYDAFGSLSSEDDNEAAVQFAEAAKPISIVVTNADGEHYGVKYDMDEISTLYKKTVLIFSEALVSAPEAVQVTESVWRDALLSCGVYFDYHAPVKLSVLDGWYGSEISGDWAEFSVRRLCVVADDAKNALYFMDEQSGNFYAAETQASGGIAEVSDSVGINSTLFAFELDGGYTSPGCYTLLKLDEAGYPVLEVANPLEEDEALESILMKLGISEHQQSSFTEGDGARVFVDEDFTIRLNTNGTLIYTKTDVGAEASSMDESEAIEQARALVASTVAQTCGSDTGVYFESSEPTDDGGCRVFFSYVVAGGLVKLSDDQYAAAVTVLSGGVTDMTLYFRNYTVTNETKQLLPEIQAAAASNGAFLLCYLDNGSDTRLEPVWIAPDMQEN